MLDLKFIRDNVNIVKKAIKDKGVEVDLDGLLAIDEERRRFLTEVEKLKHDKNVASESIGAMLKENKDATSEKEAVKTLSQKIGEIEAKIAELERSLAGNSEK